MRLAENSRKFFGLQWQGVYYLYHTIPFGWKASAYIYHTIGMGATSYIRSLGVPCSQYIDDRHVGQLTTCRKSPKSTTAWSDFELADAAAFIAAAVLISLGYFVGLAKSSLLPKRIVKFLGFLVDSQRCAFILPEDKKRKFAALRESILDRKSSSIKTLQRLAGKITSFCIAVPAAQLYCREIFKATAGYKKSARPVKIHSLLREEIEHWRFLDSWEGTLPWPSERHIVLEILSDASDYAWGGVIRSPGAPPVTIRDYWTASTRLSPIVVKEALALANVLSAGEHLISNARVDAYTDNTAFIHSWGKQGGKNTVDFFAGDRSSDLGRTLGKELLYFPDKSGILFNHTFGKTLRGDALNTFSIRRCENLDICPVYNFEGYMSICKLLKVDLRSGFLFRSTKGSSVTAEPFLGSAVYNRLKFYLGALGLDSGETPHSLRAGCSITLSLLGVPEGAILKHIGWRSASMLHHYTDLREVTRPDSPGAVLAASSAQSVSAGVLAAYNSYDDLSLFTSPLVLKS